MTKRICLLLAAGLSVLIARPASALNNEALLDSLQQTAFKYFWYESNPTNGLIKDRNTSYSPCSIASLGFGLSAICIGIDHGWVGRDEGRGRILTALQTLWTKPQGTGSGGYIGYQGLYYHFLDMFYGTRTWDCEVSTIDSALLFAGVLDAKQYFNTADPLDLQVRALADSIYYRADWEYFRNGGPGIRMGWKPGTQFSGYGEWVGYNEAMVLYILAAGSPTHPVTNPSQAWTRWTSGYNWGTQYGYTYLIFPPLFGHQYSHCWIDFRGIQDAYMRSHNSDYFVNSIRATLAQRAYCIANPGHFIGYGANLWGLTASDDPNGYLAHGAPPPQNDNGTISPTAAGGAVPFAPSESITVLQNLYNNYYWPLWGPYGFRDAFNLTVNWWDLDYLGIDEGPIIVGIENFRNGRVWSRFMQNPDVQRGLERCGFLPGTATVPGGAARTPALSLVRDLPSPLRGPASITAALSRPGPIILRVFDPQGREMLSVAKWSGGARETTFPLDPRNWPAGVYFYRLESGADRLGGRCVIIR